MMALPRPLSPVVSDINSKDMETFAMLEEVDELALAEKPVKPAAMPAMLDDNDEEEEDEAMPDDDDGEEEY